MGKNIGQILKLWAAMAPSQSEHARETPGPMSSAASPQETQDSGRSDSPLSVKPSS